MPSYRSAPAAPYPGLAFVTLALFLVLLWLAGGASREDVGGQVVVRAGASIALAALALFGPKPTLSSVRPVAGLLATAVILVLLQLVPLPPSLWQSLPGRIPFSAASEIAGQSQPWRPWTIVPGATINAAASLVVPVAMLLNITMLGDRERRWLPGMLVALVAASVLLGLLQFSGAGFNNPLINETPGQLSGSFANRNHFALFAAIGCAAAPVWAFAAEDQRRPSERWRAPAAFGLVLVFALSILASGSRSGILAGVIGASLGLVIVRRPLRRIFGKRPPWVFPAVVALIVVTMATFGALSWAAGRAASIQRLFESDPGQDMRTRGLPTVLSMIGEYLPFGGGFGAFDPLFRMHEPFGLLKYTYFNHAHNDWLEIVLDGGVFGAGLLALATLWWAAASLRVWRRGRSGDVAAARLGSATILLVFIASLFDYPARTPMMMAILVLAGTWLARGAETDRTTASALPDAEQHL